MNFQTHALVDARSSLPLRPATVDRLAIRQLRTPAEIQQIMHLREAIDLSVHAAGGGEFLTHEKKETSAASWARSNSTAGS